MIQPQPPPAERFATLLQLLQRAVAACSADGGVMAGPLIVLIWNRLGHILRRWTRLTARLGAGTFRTRLPYRRKPPQTPKPRKPSLIPRHFGWLVPLVPWRPERSFWAAHCRGSLTCLFDDPEMQELMAAAPAEMGRIIRPLCWMLGVKPPPVLARPRPARPAPAAAPEAPLPPAQSHPAEPPAPRPPKPPGRASLQPPARPPPDLA